MRPLRGLMKRSQEMLAVVDGAAFGPEVQSVMCYIETHQVACTLYAPESFEYLILRSGLIDVPRSVWEETYRFADSEKYVSWEAFYTAYLCDITRNTIFQYGKSRLVEAYATSGAVDRILRAMPAAVMHACERLGGGDSSRT